MKKVQFIVLMIVCLLILPKPVLAEKFEISGVSERYGLDKLQGTHGIGHARMATESGVDIKSAHPFWGYPFSDVSVVHNGQLTNYWNNRRSLEYEKTIMPWALLSKKRYVVMLKLYPKDMS